MIRCLLLASSGPHLGCGVSVRATESILVGRNTPRGLSIRDDLYLSREHFAVRSEGSNFRLIDIQSRNGTFLNGQRIFSSAILSDGDVVRAGGTEFHVEIHDDAQGSRRVLPTFSHFPEKKQEAQADAKSESDSINETRRYVDGLSDLIAIRSLSGITKGQGEQSKATDSRDTVYVGAVEPSSAQVDSSSTAESSAASASVSGLPPGVEESWLEKYGLSLRPSHRNSFYAFQSYDLFALSQFLNELHQRYDFYLIVNRAELQPTERVQLNKFIVEGQAGNLSSALLWVHGWKIEELDKLFKMIFAKDCGIVFGVPVESKIRSKDIQQFLGPLSYPSVLVRTFNNENLVMVETLFQSIDVYIVEAKLDRPAWYLYTSPRFFGVYRR